MIWVHLQFWIFLLFLLYAEIDMVGMWPLTVCLAVHNLIESFMEDFMILNTINFAEMTRREMEFYEM